MTRGRFTILILACLFTFQLAEAQQPAPNEVSRRLGILTTYIEREADAASQDAKMLNATQLNEFQQILETQATQSPSTFSLQATKEIDAAFVGWSIKPDPIALNSKKGFQISNLNVRSAIAKKFASDLKELQQQIAFLPEQAALDKLQSVVIPPSLLVVFDKQGDYRPSQQAIQGQVVRPTGAPPPVVPITTYIYVDPDDGGFTTDYPAVGAILYDNADQVMKTGCTGTLIASNIVITAAHCNFHTDGEPKHPKAVYFQHAGVFELARAPIVHSDVQKDPAKQPDFSKLPDADLALLVLDKPVTGIKPARINDAQSVKGGTDGRIVGYGGRRYNTQQSSPQATMALAAMGLKVKARIKTSKCAGVAHLERSICWQFEKKSGYGTTCKGDSGGPLFIRIPGGEDVLFGVTSGSLDGPCAVASQAYDVDIGKFVPWIKEKIEEFRNFHSRANLTALEAATNETHWFILPPSYQHVPLAGDRLVVKEAVDLPGNLEMLRVGVNATIRGVRIGIEMGPENGPSQTLSCQPDAPGHIAFCEVRAPAPGRWIMTFRGDVNQEFQAVATVFRKTN